MGNIMVKEHLNFLMGKKIGEFRDGTDWNTKWYSRDDEITGEYVNGILVSGGNLSDK